MIQAELFKTEFIQNKKNLSPVSLASLLEKEKKVNYSLRWQLACVGVGSKCCKASQLAILHEMTETINREPHMHNSPALCEL